jgi:glyoxylase-like metal-dependent hydrolase (beta-lactamase superfamily II)
MTAFRSTVLSTPTGPCCPTQRHGRALTHPAPLTQVRDNLYRHSKRFNVDVRYAIMTHGHFDHIGGSQVLQEAGATVVAHRNAVEPIVGEKLPTAVPDKVFDKELTIELGGETVKLHHIAASHSNSMVLVHFPRQKALQCSDVCQSKTLPYMDFLDFYYDGWIQTLDWVLVQDVEFIDVGHYSPATKEDQRALRDYMIDLHALF